MNFKMYHLNENVNHIKVVVPYPLLFSEKKLLFTKMHDILSLSLEKRSFWEVTFISFLAFSSLASRYSPKTTLLDRSSISQELLCSPVCREVVTLPFPTKLVSNATAIREEVRSRVFSLIVVRVECLDWLDPRLAKGGSERAPGCCKQPSSRGAYLSLSSGEDPAQPGRFAV